MSYEFLLRVCSHVIETLSNIGKSSFIWDVGGSILVNMGKCSKRTSISSRLGTSMRAVGGIWVLGIESSLDMVIVSPSLWKKMLSTTCALGAGGDGGIDISEEVRSNLEDEPFSLVLCFFDDGLTSMASFNLFCCRLWNSAHKLATISFSLAFSILGVTTYSMVSHHSIRSTLNVLSDSVTVSCTWG